jgi:hypothetical protein
VAAPRLPLFEYVEEKILPLNFLKKDYQNGISLLPIRGCDVLRDKMMYDVLA